MKYTKIFLCFVAISIAASGCTFTIKKHSNYQEACKELDFETAREVMNELHQNYISAQSNLWDRDRKKEEGKYYDAFDYIYKAEIQYLLSMFDEDECVDKIIFLLEEIPIEGKKPDEGMCSDYMTSGGGEITQKGRPFDAYIIWTEHYNRLCNTILTLSINRNYTKLAKVILMHFVDNIEVVEQDNFLSFFSSTVDVRFLYNSTDRDAAKKEYDEAVKSGLLKNEIIRQNKTSKK